MMILFHSVTCDDLSVSCLRRRLLDFFENTKPQQIAGIERNELERRAAQDNRRVVNPPSPFESWFEVDVALELLRRDFTVLAQHEVAGKRLDLVVEGGQARLAVECDGDNWHRADLYEDDMQRQRQLERCGWEFFRVRESAFYANKENALLGLWRVLEERGIFSKSQRVDLSREVDLEAEDSEPRDIEASVINDGEGDDEDCSSDDSEAAFTLSGRRAEEITAAEIEEAILQALSKCPNHSCTLHSLTARVLREVGVLTRGKPREAFERRTMRCVSTLEKGGRIESYKAKNRRLRLVTNLFT
jgi:very-short-patch-repair endonuclease